VWTFSCRVPPGRGSKPALSGDWFSFVRSKDLKAGDAIEIALDREKDQAGGSQFTIKVKKTIQQLGTSPFHLHAESCEPLKD